MSLLSSAIHLGGKVAAPVLKANAAVNSFTGNDAAAEKSRQMADAIIDPNQVFTGGLSTVLDKNQTSFSPVAPAATIPVSSTKTTTTDPNANKNPDPYAGDTAAAAKKASDLAYIDDQSSQLRDFLARTGVQLDNGNKQLEYDYNKSAGDMDQDHATAQGRYDTQVTDTTQSKDQAIDRNNTKYRSLANSVRNLIGAASGSGSSAYQITAPGAITDSASNDRTDIQTTFGRNFRDIDTSRKDEDTQYTRNKRDLGDQRKQKEEALREGVMNSQNTAEGTLADLARQKAALSGADYNGVRAASAPLQASIAERNAQIDNLFKTYATPYSVQAVNAATPQLSDYITGGQKVTTAGAGVPVTTAAYAPWLKDGQDDTDQLF